MDKINNVIYDSRRKISLLNNLNESQFYHTFLELV